MKRLPLIIVAALAVAALVSVTRANAAQDIASRMGTSKVTSVANSGAIVNTSGQASTAEGESTRTQWFQMVAGVAQAEQTPGSTMVHRKVLNSSSTIDQDADSITSDGVIDKHVFSDSDDSLTELVAHASRRATVVDATVLEVNYVPLFGGIAEYVLQPNNEKQFFSEASARVYSFLGAVEDGDPFLVTVRNSTGVNRLIMGFVPALGSGEGLYISYVAPDLDY